MVNFNEMDKSYNVSLQIDLVNTKESVLPVCHKPNHTNNKLLQTCEETGNLRN